MSFREIIRDFAFIALLFADGFYRGLRGHLDAEKAAEPPLRQIIDVLQQVMCKHDAGDEMQLCEFDQEHACTSESQPYIQYNED